MSEGFYKRRRGILEHLEHGRISLLDLAVHDYLNLRANLVIGGASSLPAGVCHTSAVAIHAMCPSQISERAIQRSLEHLESIGWIKRWNVRGKRGNYPVLVCRASVHDLSAKEYRVNGLETTDWKHPKYDPVGDLSALREVGDAKLSGDREERSKRREERKEKSRAPHTGAETILPEWLPLDAWNEFLEMRKVNRKKLTAGAIKYTIRELAKLREAGEDVRAVLEQSISRSYTGVFPVSGDRLGGSSPPKSFDQLRNERNDAASRNVMEYFQGRGLAKSAAPQSFDAMRNAATDAALKRVLDRGREALARSCPATSHGLLVESNHEFEQ